LLRYRRHEINIARQTVSRHPDDALASAETQLAAEAKMKLLRMLAWLLLTQTAAFGADEMALRGLERRHAVSSLIYTPKTRIRLRLYFFLGRRDIGQPKTQTYCLKGNIANLLDRLMYSDRQSGLIATNIP